MVSIGCYDCCYQLFTFSADSQGNPRIQPNSKGRKRKPGAKSLKDALRTEDELFIDFVRQCLQWDPEQRLKPDDAFNHPWIKDHRRGR